MIRKIYIDLLLRKFSDKEYGRLFSLGRQYLLTHLSSLLRRPFCGPILGTLVTNYRCNYRCVMCGLPQRDMEFNDRGLREFDTARMLRVIDEFASLGVSGIGFTGGEPLLRKDVFELLAHAKRRGMISHLNTNGALLDDTAARNIVSAGVDSLNVSLDGAHAKTHDAIRGVEGAFEKAVRAVERAIAARKRSGAGLRIKTVAVLGEDNIDEAVEIVGLSQDLGADCVEFIPQQPFAVGKQNVPAAPTFQGKVETIAGTLIRMKRSGARIENSLAHLRLFSRSFSGEPSPLKCFAGYNSLAVDCYGEIYPCVPWYNWRRPAGNVQETDLEGFWYSKRYNRLRKEVSGCRGCYLNCQAELNILFSPLSIRDTAA
ncbi:MAG: heme b synthase [Thermodesulfovibrionales bacterium]